MSGSASTSASGSAAGVVERVDELDARLVAVRDGELDQAQERPVAPLRHELGVDPEHACLARPLGHLCYQLISCHLVIVDLALPTRIGNTRRGWQDGS